MTTLRQAAQQALEALCSAVEPKNGKVYARGFEPIDCYAMHEQAIAALRTALEQKAKMRMPRVGDKVICLEDESLGTVESLTAGGSPDITFDDGSRGTYMLREFAELFGYVTPPQQQEPVLWAMPDGKIADKWALQFYSGQKGKPLYTTPPQRPWVGLTEEDWEQIHNRKGTALDTFAQGAVWAETQLRERNK